MSTLVLKKNRVVLVLLGFILAVLFAFVWINTVHASGGTTSAKTSCVGWGSSGSCTPDPCDS